MKIYKSIFLKVLLPSSGVRFSMTIDLSGYNNRLLVTCTDVKKTKNIIFSITPKLHKKRRRRCRSCSHIFSMKEWPSFYTVHAPSSSKIVHEVSNIVLPLDIMKLIHVYSIKKKTNMEKIKVLQAKNQLSQNYEWISFEISSRRYHLY